MLDAFQVTLAAINPKRDCFRSYRIEAGTDLFGTWLVEATFGRIGRPGRTLRFTACDEIAARERVRSILKLRSTAVRRLGVPYECLTDHDPAGWMLSIHAKSWRLNRFSQQC